MATLDERLAEIDSQLREMQAELLPDRVPDEPHARPRPPSTEQLPPEQPHAEALVEISRRLLASLRELVVGYETVLSSPARAGCVVAAGPFRSTAALGDFERSLARIPGVREVALRGFEGSDRAIVEVQLEG